MTDEPKKKTNRKLPDDIVSVICRTQGVGTKLAESIASKLTKEQQDKVVALAKQKNAGQEILLLLKPEEKKTPEKSPDKTPATKK